MKHPSPAGPGPQSPGAGGGEGAGEGEGDGTQAEAAGGEAGFREAQAGPREHDGLEKGAPKDHFAIYSVLAAPFSLTRRWLYAPLKDTLRRALPLVKGSAHLAQHDCPGWSPFSPEFLQFLILWSAPSKTIDDEAAMRRANEEMDRLRCDSGGEKCRILPFTGEISCRCFTGCQKYF